MPPLIILAGPTATGKSETAVALAEHLNTEIISADSMQVYRHFDIGTAKPAPELRARVPHHLIDLIEPGEEFTAYDFKTRAESFIESLHGRQRIPVLAGGTGLYLQVLIQDRDCAVAVDPELRDRIRDEMEILGPELLHTRLLEVDPVTAARVKPTDTSRIERALAVYQQTGTPLSEFHRSDKTGEASPYQVHMFVFEMERARLYDAINTRVDRMMESGWLEEVQRLLARGYSETLKPFQGIGYTQLVRHLRQGLPLEDAVREIKQETRHYAKRQITWFKKQPGIHPVPVNPSDTPVTLKDKILSLLPKVTAALALIAGMALPPDLHAEEASLEEPGKWIQQGKADAACKHLENVHAPQPDTSIANRRHYLLGLCRSALKQYPQAIAHFESALKSLPELEDYIRLGLARARLESGAPEPALKQVTALLQKFPDTRVAPEAELVRARTLHQLGQTGKAVFFLEEAEHRWSRQEETDPEFTPLIPDLILEQARLHEQKKAFSRAYLNYRRLYVRYPNHQSATEAETAMRRLVKAYAFDMIPLMEYEMTERVDGLLQAARYQEALDTLQNFRKAFPKQPLPPNGYLALATAYNGLRERDRVIEILEQFLKEYPLDTRIQDARFRLGRTLWNLGRNSEALRYFKLILKTTLKKSWKTRAHFFIARVYENTGQADLARPHYLALLEMGGNHLYVEKSGWRLAWIAIKDKQWNKALAQLQENFRKRPQGIYAPKNLFWSAKVNEFIGRKEDALTAYARLLEEFPYSYYGVRAETKLETLKHEIPADTQPRVVKTGFIPLEETPGSIGRALTEPEQFHHKRALALSEMGLYALARREARKAASTIRKNLSGVLWTSDLFLKTKDFPEALRVLYLYRDYKQTAGEKELPVVFWKNFFPQAYTALIENPAREHGVDPFFVNGLIRQESLFDADIVSPAGARGLMQIMPETGRRLFTPGDGYTRYNPDALFDPRVNIRLGVKYLGQLIQRYGNNGVYLLISYNAGPHVLEKWLKRFAGIEDEDLFIESLPYPETRGYVQRVLRNLGIYKRLYAEPETPPDNKSF